MENRNSQQELEKLKQKYYELYNFAPVGYLSLDQAGKILEVNLTAAELLGETPADLINKNFNNYIVQNDKDIFYLLLAKLMETKQNQTCEFKLIKKDGIEFFGQVVGKLALDESNNFISCRAVLLDISKRKEAEQALKESEARFKKLITNSFDMIVLMDSSGIQTYVSESCEKILGYKQAELIGVSVVEKMIHPDDQESTKKDFLDIIENKANGGAQYRHLHKNGSWVYLEAYGTNQLDNPEIKSIVLNVRDITERKHAEEALQQSESILKAIFDSTAIGLLIIDNNGKVIHRNAKFNEMLHIPSKLINSTDDGELIDFVLSQLSEPNQFIDKVKELSGSSSSNYDAIYFKDGRVFERRSNPLSEKEIVKGRVWSFNDITERKQAEIELLKAKEKSEESELLLKQTQKLSKMGGWSYDVESNQMTYTEALYEIHGTTLLTPEEGIKFYHPDDREMIWKSFSEAITKQKPYDLEGRFINAQGDKLFVRTIGKPLIKNGKVVKVNGNLVDITEQKTAELKLKDSEKKYSSLVRNIPGASFRCLIDEHWTMVFISDNVEKISGFPASDFIQSQVRSYSSICLDDLKNTDKVAMNAVKRKESYTVEYRIVRADGEYCWVLEKGQGVFNDQGEPLYLDGIILDITKRKQAEEALRDSKERIQMLNKVIWHDIANDLAVISSAVNVFKRSADQSMMAEIEKRVRKTVDTIYQYKKQENFIDSHNLFSELIIEDVVNKIAKDHPEVTIELEGQGSAFADELLYSVFENLINNAVNHGAAQNIKISINTDDQFCNIRVADNGSGIPDKIKSKIFDEGFIFGETGHTGIGLFIVKLTIESYGGTIEVEDNQPNGTAFVINLRKAN